MSRSPHRRVSLAVFLLRPPARFLSPGVWLAVACAAFCLGATTRAESEEPPTQGAAITSVKEFWNLPDSERRFRRPVRLQFVVYFHDPYWQLLWGRDGDDHTFLHLTGTRRVLEPGRRILIEGSVAPGNDLSIDEQRVTVLPEFAPVEARSADGDLSNALRWRERIVEFDAYVNGQTETDANHLTLELVVGTQPVVGIVLIDNGKPVPQLEGALVRIRGVYLAKHDATGQLAGIDVWVARPEDIQTRGWLDSDARFARPATPIEALPRADAAAWVRVAGVVRAIQPGRSITVRDETGQVTLRTLQRIDAQPGDLVEAVGHAVAGAFEWELTDSLVRRSHDQRPAPPNRGLPKLRVIEQVRELTAEEAARAYPVRVTGVVTWSHSSAPYFFVQDGSGGVRVRRDRASEPVPEISSRVTIDGVTIAGGFAPEIALQTIERLDHLALPKLPPATLEQAMTGIEEAQRVSMSGYVRDVSTRDGWPRLRLVTTAGEFEAILPPDRDGQALRGSVVRLHGVCTATANTRRQLTGIELHVGSPEDVEIEEPAPTNPFGAPLQTIASLREHRTLRAAARRVRIAGIVVQCNPGRELRIQDGSDSLLVFSEDQQPPALGDRVEVVGFPGRQSGRMVLREAVYRRQAAGPEPAPVALRTLVIDDEFDGRLVQIEGQLLDAAGRDGSPRLTIRSGEVSFDATLEDGPHSVPADWRPGSSVSVKGVYEILRDEHLHPKGMALQLRTANDVTVLARPPWWTAGRAWTAAASLAAVGLLGGIWIVALRRQVRRQTEHIRGQVEKSARLELELIRASKLESLGVLAGGIAHDFNNLLTVIMGNITLVLGDKHIDEESELCLRNGERAALRARDLTLQLLTFAKGGAPVRTSLELPEIVREATQFALHGSNVRGEFDFAADLWPAEADKGQLSQVLHNLVLNAKQAMASGGVVKISLQNEEIPAGQISKPAPGRYVRVSVTDHGAGIGPEHLERVFEPYFTTKKHGNGLGLATVYSIVKRHGGHIDVQSTLGIGTTFRFWLPATSHRLVAPISAPKPVQRKTGRVLFMDDEEFVRQVAVTLLKRIGCHATAVGDGAAAVKEFAAAHEAGNPFHVVILDLTVPGGMGGAEAIAEMRRVDPEVRAIVSSGYSNDPVMANYEAYGFKAVVPKPYEAGDLKEAIHRLLAGN